MAASDAENRVAVLSGLLQLSSEMRACERLADLNFVVTNDTRRVVPYRQAFYWSVTETGRVEIEACYGVSEVDSNAPVIGFFRELVDYLRAQEWLSEPETLTAGNFSGELKESWSSWLAAYGLSLPVFDEQGQCVGGLFYAAEDPWNDAAIKLMSEVRDVFAHARRLLRPRGYSRRAWSHLKRNRLLYLGAIVLVLMIPIRQYVLADAEVVPKSPHVVAAPMGGAISEVAVEPNQPVEEGDLLFEYEDLELRNEVETTEKAVEVARAELKRNQQQAFKCEKCRARLPELRATLEQKEAELVWARNRLERSRVYAPESGVAVFADASELEGKPVKVGESVMRLAREDQTRMRINVSVDNAIATRVGTEVVLHLNVNPLKRYPGTISRTSYEAEPQGEKKMVYPLMAEFDDEMPRLGLRGTAKIYGDWAPLGLYLFRRPISWVRRNLGI